MMKRMILVLTITALMILSSALPALADMKDGKEGAEPDPPDCGWYESWNDEEEWWEYWCYYPHWGWDYVFWSY